MLSGCDTVVIVRVSGNSILSSFQTWVSGSADFLPDLSFSDPSGSITTGWEAVPGPGVVLSVGAFVTGSFPPDGAVGGIGPVSNTLPVGTP